MSGMNDSKWIASHGLPPFLAVVVIGTPVVMLATVAAAWFVLPLNGTGGLEKLLLLLIFGAVGCFYPIFGLQKFRPRKIRVDAMGMVLQPVFGREVRVPWSSVDPCLPQPEGKGYQRVIYRIPGSPLKRAAYLCRNQWEDIRQHPGAPVWKPYSPPAKQK